MKKISYLMLLALPALLVATNLLNAQPADTLVKSYIDKIDELSPGMGHEDLVSRKDPQLQFEKICFEASGPGKENQREALCKAIIAKVGPETAKPARVWLLRKLEPIGRDEVVDGLVKLMHDKDAQIRELARRALQNNPSENAAAALRTELANTQDAKWRVALINALGFRGDVDSLDQIGELAKDKDVEVVAAAVAAMGKIGNVAAAAKLKELQKSAPAELKDRIVEAKLQTAEKLLDSGNRNVADEIYATLLKSKQPERIRIAALRGLTKARRVKVIPRLLKLINGNDVHMSMAAARCAIGVPGSTATRELAVALLKDASVDVQIMLLDVLAQRRDQTALPVVVKMLESDKEDIRLAALNTLACVGNGTVVQLLAERASKTKGKEREAARNSLASMPGKDVDQTILKRMVAGEALVRAEIIKAAAERRITDALPKLYDAAGDPEEQVRTAVALALGMLAPNEDFPKIVGLLNKAEGKKTLWATEIALTEISLRKGDREQRSKAIIDLMPTAKPIVQASMIRVLAKIGGPDAFKTILAKRNADEKDVKNSAIRTLSAWKNPVAIKPLWKIVETTDNKSHRQQALRGYVRLVRLPSERKAEDTYDMLAKAVKYAADNDDKKKVLAGMGEVAHIKALNFVLERLDEPALQEQASGAVLSMAVGLSGWHRDEAIAAVERVRKITKDDKIRAEIESTLDAMKKNIVAWQMSGPFKKEGKKGTDLFDMPFAPEQSGADAKWKPLTINNMKQPGRFDFNRGNNQCVYFKSSVYSEKEQKAMLVLGTDDGVKAWLNDAVVHGNNASRGLNCESDKVPVTLKKGWNPLMLKVINGGGGWGFCCAVKAPDDSLIDGLKFKAE